ncbi:alpha/beta hydrolase [Aureisphaera sp. CAU 1614]|uniref:Alpha/beta hydrolase n=1 Tax=Halomarinibacterium sedimenti TaxID=2857106 RepID=A0A9X1FP64_9FLAO|nr:alpha/beta hydrolase [Halomarinibacterium sedimenti]MBW2938126.1 alpha/beta hydrolase [Halomarinibacterium sedimenti]
MTKIHLYFVPGLAASKEIFKNIVLPIDQYEVHIIEWLIPEKKESLTSYAQRMAAFVTEENAVLVGVSFGGVVVQEMSKFLELQKLIIISSVKSKQELPKRFTVAKVTMAYKLLPTSIVSSVGDLTKFAIGPRSKKRLRLYNEYLSIKDKDYLDWAIEKMVNWNRNEVDTEVYHIHGDFDAVFPIKNIKNANILEGGTHIMILNKGSKVSKMLQNIIENH